MNKTFKLSKSMALFSMLTAIVGTSACSTTTVEAARPIAVTVVAPAATPVTMGNIPNVASSSGQFNTLLTAATAAGLGETLSAVGPITVFAPTDAAFDKLPPATLQQLMRPANREALRQIVAYHVLNGRVDAAGLVGKTMSSPTLEGSSLAIDGRGGVMVNGARVLQSDIQASNGVIHSIDTVLMPPDMVALR